jgi:drug/metabolite transporter (DMT)-like permease
MFYLIFTSLIWAFSFGLIKSNLTNLSPDFVAFIRLALPLLLFLPVYKKNKLSSKEQIRFFLIGAIQYGLMYSFCIRAYAYLPAHLIVLFTACTPIYITLLNDLINKSFKPLFLFAAILALISICFLYGSSFHFAEIYKGFILVQLSDLCFAFGIVTYKKSMLKHKKVKDKELYALLFLGASSLTAISTTLFGGWNSFALLSIKQASLLAYLGLIASGLCFFFWNKATSLVNTGTFAVFNNLKIPLGILVSLVVFGEKTNIFNLLLSSSLILLGLLLTEKSLLFKTNRN